MHPVHDIRQAGKRVMHGVHHLLGYFAWLALHLAQQC